MTPEVSGSPIRSPSTHQEFRAHALVSLLRDQEGMTELHEFEQPCEIGRLIQFKGASPARMGAEWRLPLSDAERAGKRMTTNKDR